MRYEHYLLGNSVPLRVVYNDDGHRIGAEVPAHDNRTLVKDATYLSRIDHSFEIEAISEAEFEQHCQRVWDSRNL